MRNSIVEVIHWKSAQKTPSSIPLKIEGPLQREAIASKNIMVLERFLVLTDTRKISGKGTEFDECWPTRDSQSKLISAALYNT